MWAEAKYYAGMARGVWSYLRHPHPADPMGLLRRGVEEREEAFLRLARDAAYAFPESSLCRLLYLARCEYPDLEAMVRRRGLEAALRALCDAGVYVTHDEFKGRVPLVRDGQEIPGGEKRFRNPLMSGGPATISRSSGSRTGGRGTPTPKSVRYQAYTDAYFEVWRREYDLRDYEWAQILQILPSKIGLSRALRTARMGQPTRRWFTTPSSLTEAGHYRLTTTALLTMARAMGYDVPYPTTLPENDFTPVARYLDGRKCAVLAFPSPAVRVADAALRHGCDLSRVIFFSGGEATTAAKRAVIARAGARMATMYHISEVGPVGYGCRHMQTNDVHLLQDSVAAIVRRRPAPLSDEPVDALAFTTLLPFAPRFLINAEMDDAGVIEQNVACDCEYGRLGMTTVVREAASFGKLTGQGMTLYGSDVVGILERGLPGRFGGGPGDYQLVERDLGGQTQVELRASPRALAPAADLAQVRDFFLDQLKAHYGGTMAARVWLHADGIRAVREEPIATYSGKILPLALLGNQQDAAMQRQHR